MVWPDIRHVIEINSEIVPVEVQVREAGVLDPVSFNLSLGVAVLAGQSDDASLEDHNHPVVL